MEKTKTEGLWGGVYGSPEKVFSCAGEESKLEVETGEQAVELVPNERGKSFNLSLAPSWDVD